MMKERFACVSLFCGAGGLDLGFENAGAKTIWAVDNDKNACETFRNWNKDATVVCEDISKILDIPDSDIILGGFPCQGFSLSGPRKIDDKRNSLYKHYVRIVQSKKPFCFVGENVKGLLSMANGEIIEAIIREFSDCGYNVFFKFVDAKNYGVPQDRERVILVGFRKDLKIERFDFPEENSKIVTLKEALKDIPSPSPEDICSQPFSSRYMSRNRKRNWNEVSFTIPAMAKQVPLYPGSPDMKKIDSDHWVFGEGITRRLSWREASAIQTFPREFRFSGDLIDKYKQIGNAVPVRLAEKIGASVLEALKEREKINVQLQT